MKIEFTTNNDAFAEYKIAEIARIMKKITDNVYQGLTDGVIHDINGNSIGKWEI